MVGYPRPRHVMWRTARNLNLFFAFYFIILLLFSLSPIEKIQPASSTWFPDRPILSVSAFLARARQSGTSDSVTAQCPALPPRSSSPPESPFGVRLAIFRSCADWRNSASVAASPIQEGTAYFLPEPSGINATLTPGHLTALVPG